MSLWSEGILGSDNPKSLLRAVFYQNGKNFCLRGGCERRNLKLLQFQRLSNPARYIYTENGSKNRSGSLSEGTVENKTVLIGASAASPVLARSMPTLYVCHRPTGRIAHAQKHAKHML